MAFGSVRSVVICMLSVVAFTNVLPCEGQYLQFRNYEPMYTTPLPFPPCKIDNLDCLRRGLRTFLILMETGKHGMKPIDPIIINSVTVALPNEQMSFLMRHVNVTGAKWSKLDDRKFNLIGGKNGIQFSSNLHITGEIIMSMAGRIDPFIAYITMDIYEIESNITYAITGQRGYDNEDYILIGPERIAVRNTGSPKFFLQPGSSRVQNRTIVPDTEESYMIQQVLTAREPILDHMANEITIAVMHEMVNNFRIFASKVPVRHYYTYNKK
ncbi:juvenile hormone-binding protein-like isoform X2 [Epargyreus clarus]|uniref:juvenile hormone-binding protein-like isoform X2 n=1 Tax=Epargyreus clarus TaxID=520877 RepID=UPI003C2BA686